MQKIIHIDADCFFAAVEMRDRPALRNNPIAVGGDPGRRGVIATCNYPARRYGVKSAMASAHAKRLCPHLLILPPNMAKYRVVSQQMRDIFCEYTSIIEPLSLDEAFLDVSNSDCAAGSATLIAQEIRQRIARELGIHVSAGASQLKFLAKIASDWQKPNGLMVIPPGEEQYFLRRLSVAKLPGVGPVMQRKLAMAGITQCEDVLNIGLNAMVVRFGAIGERIFKMSKGIEFGRVASHSSRKSISVESTFDCDLSSADAIKQRLPDLISRLRARLPDSQAFSSQFVKIKFSNFDQKTMESRLGTSNKQFSEESFLRLMLAAWHSQKLPARLLGVGLKMSPAYQFGQLELPFEEINA